ncbi:MAG: hypothetical protein ACTH8W_16150, partial [Brachybacterium tyrofermentans]
RPIDVSNPIDVSDPSTSATHRRQRPIDVSNPIDVSDLSDVSGAKLGESTGHSPNFAPLALSSGAEFCR